MTDDEFADWLDHCRVVFSEVNRLATDDDAPTRLKKWRLALARVPHAKAVEFVGALLEGRVPMPRYRSDWDAFPARLMNWQRETGRPWKPTQAAIEPDRQKKFREALRQNGYSRLADRCEAKDQTA